MALAKYDLIKIWVKYRDADLKFLESYNTGTLYPDIYKTLNHVGIGALYHWRDLVTKNNDWMDLVCNYKYSDSQTYRTKLSEQEIQIFLKILLSPNQFSIGKAISLTTHVLQQRGIEDIPKEVTFRRYAKWYKTNNFDKIVEELNRIEIHCYKK